ncbi:bifunctional hydroxymethylpyrimidine kinase/phosphomethylpyrimidine kinase [Waterburya agarophytonicola K14]|uniref:Bifunctional hydroxymethylpyrimidine kinase/phosphomethylpyrimidine kinase n=1 Tax=Waterburya agarophytonicola KI4 TaxID=2874699 RepID=A0A964FIL9_9CYAN|nr:bifunctional hydroxymethylpyrimidine kinase/phosphomethylpyrimidine kinase [Waterburya agarophytonicola]MCC0178574.1 bifunctional hydroxymethylpyrimidine kinase/phosphomethylpyrimidine kinase [Waterburya agarophytonicola KI4]
MTQIALTIAGSDSGGGAGIQADLKTFALHCVHGTSALTCVTAQNTLGVTQVEAMTVSMVKAQIEAVGSDFTVNSVKTGMLLHGEIIEGVAESINKFGFSKLVVDPVMVSRAGVQLIDDDAIALLTKLLIPQAAIVTPNRYEAEILSGLTINTIEEVKQAAVAIYERLGAKVVLVKGGGLLNSHRGTDIWYDGTELKILSEKAIETSNTHGTGCTLSAAICANLALEQDLWSSVIAAKKYVTAALKNFLNIGAGNGPVGHFFPLIKKI